MRLSLSFTGFGSILADLPAVHAAEECGFDGVWYAEHICAHDAVVPATLYLRETERLELALMGINAAGRHPGLAAMELASLAEIAPGRVRAAIGTGVPDMIAQLGRSVEKPIASTIALHQALKTALAGGEITEEYPGFSFAQYKLNPLAAPPALDIMAVRPRMVDTAARYADGICLSAGSSLAYLSRTVQTVEKILAATGRTRESFRVSVVIPAFITDDSEGARMQVAALLSSFDAGTTEYLAAGAIPPGALVAAAASGPAEAIKVFTPDVIDAVAMVCSPDGVGEKLAAYAETGVDEIAVAPFMPPEQVPDVIRLLAANRPAMTAAS
ncbi:LLM class flavin-dependent oxidoreductase [Mycolicibacterium alvei]|uniref:LLM class F420-dependent oxidoreductase n=1 Tax=Mycolicibacterium alvei TaxID=67081 RepID=A0A6N4UVJ2_9MYCO|nr:LLM class flavin-dependent oxidoreductase [Mycolicibacterium alvei]MCV7003928.1 LLM class flavin-dependent oxidoreductase [Mycolicibacterium alvei]BBX27687.1 LLM class F420-dependent oxidoreductase [Mycolicibacterium alvei]